jgi:putative ABC transport system permease protein
MAYGSTTRKGDLMFRERLHDLWVRLKAIFMRRQLDRDLAEELEFHLAMREQKLIEQGMSPREARYAARRGFGNVASLKETSRAMWGFPSLETILQDARYGLRMLRRSPGFTAVAVVTLALGIGGTTAIFNVLYGGLLNPLPYKDTDHLAVLMTHDPNQPRFDGWAWVSAAEFVDFQQQNHVFDQVIGGLPEDMLLTGPDRPADWFNGMRLTLNTFQVLGMGPIIGRGFTADDAKPGAPAVVLLNYKVWQSKFARNPAIVGQTILLNHRPVTMIGVMPPRFKWYGGGDGPSGWLPAVFSKAVPKDQNQTSPVVGHLKPGVTIAQASVDLAFLAKRFAAAYPKQHPKGITFSVLSLTEACVDKQSQRTLSLVMGGVGLLLLIACVNVANLLLARATGREREFAVRASLGADRVRLVRQLMIESLVLALGGALLGSLIAWDVQSGLTAIIPSWYMPTEAEVRMNGWVMLFAVGMALAATLLFGLAPAVMAIGKNLQAPLKASGRGAGESLSHNRLRNLLVVSEVTLSLVLLTGAGLLFRSFWALRHIELGYKIDNVLHAGAGLPQERYKTAEQRNLFHLEILRRVRGLPGVASAALGWPSLNWANSTPIEVAGEPATEGQSAWFRLAGDGYFETLGIPLLEGRTISDEDLVHARTVVVVNLAFVNKYLAGKNPLGRQVKVTVPPWPGFPPMKETRLEIVGVVADTRHAESLEPMTQPQIFLPFTIWGIPWDTLLVRTAAKPEGLVNTIRQEFATLDKDLPVDAAPIRGDFQDWYTEPQFVLGMLTGFAALGMTLVCIGVYSVLSYSVSRRAHEIGVRMALGAEATDVRRYVLKAGLKWLIVGIGIGVPASIALAKILQSRVWGIKSADPLTLVVVSTILIAVGLAACYFPACRATRVDPLVALRYE